MMGHGMVWVQLDGVLAVSNRFFYATELQECPGQADMKGRTFQTERHGSLKVR
jgi:hypothetical protein